MDFRSDISSCAFVLFGHNINVLCNFFPQVVFARCILCAWVIPPLFNKLIRNAWYNYLNKLIPFGLLLIGTLVIPAGGPGAKRYGGSSVIWYSRYFNSSPTWTKWPTFSQTTFLNAFSCIKILEFGFKFRWNLFLGVEITISQHSFR